MQSVKAAISYKRRQATGAELWRQASDHGVTTCCRLPLASLPAWREEKKGGAQTTLCRINNDV